MTSTFAGRRTPAMAIRHATLVGCAYRGRRWVSGALRATSAAAAAGLMVVSGPVVPGVVLLVAAVLSARSPALVRTSAADERA